MESYTELMQDAIYKEYDLVDDYEEAIAAFIERDELDRSFGQALSSFLEKNCGYIPESEPVETFLKKKIRGSSVDKSIGEKIIRNSKSWFAGNARAGSREQLFALAFALGLNEEKTKMLFHKVYLDRAFDYRNADEIIYYYCLKNGKDWNDVIRLKSAIAGSTSTDTDFTVATQMIKTDIDNSKDDAELISYINHHKHNLSLKEVSAKKNLEYLIYGDKMALSIAQIEADGDDCYVGYDRSSLNFLYSVITMQNVAGEKGTQTLFTKEVTSKFNSGVFRCFPEAKSLAGNNLSYEEMRKSIILIFSYWYWNKAEKANKRIHIDDYVSELNGYLEDSGMPLMYPGNPYDWLFLRCTEVEELPLNSFRSVIGEIVEADIDN